MKRFDPSQAVLFLLWTKRQRGVLHRRVNPTLTGLTRLFGLFGLQLYLVNVQLFNPIHRPPAPRHLAQRPRNTLALLTRPNKDPRCRRSSSVVNGEPHEFLNASRADKSSNNLLYPKVSFTLTHSSMRKADPTTCKRHHVPMVY